MITITSCTGKDGEEYRRGLPSEGGKGGSRLKRFLERAPLSRLKEEEYFDPQCCVMALSGDGLAEAAIQTEWNRGNFRLWTKVSVLYLDEFLCMF